VIIMQRWLGNENSEAKPRKRRKEEEVYNR